MGDAGANKRKKTPQGVQKTPGSEGMRLRRFSNGVLDKAKLLTLSAFIIGATTVASLAQNAPARDTAKIKFPDRALSENEAKAAIGGLWDRIRLVDAAAYENWRANRKKLRLPDSTVEVDYMSHALARRTQGERFGALIWNGYDGKLYVDSEKAVDATKAAECLAHIFVYYATRSLNYPVPPGNLAKLVAGRLPLDRGGAREKPSPPPRNAPGHGRSEERSLNLFMRYIMGDEKFIHAMLANPEELRKAYDDWFYPGAFGRNVENSPLPWIKTALDIENGKGKEGSVSEVESGMNKLDAKSGA